MARGTHGSLEQNREYIIEDGKDDTYFHGKVRVIDDSHQTPLVEIVEVYNLGYKNAQGGFAVGDQTSIFSRTSFQVPSST